MKRFRIKRLAPVLLLFAAVLLRAAIPAGYMPAAAGSGLLFEFCPEGVSAEFMQILAGDTGREHSHSDHGAGDGEEHHCPIGHMLNSAAAVDDHWQAEIAPLVPAIAGIPLYSYSYTLRTSYLSRAPPA